MRPLFFKLSAFALFCSASAALAAAPGAFAETRSDADASAAWQRAEDLAVSSADPDQLQRNRLARVAQLEQDDARFDHLWLDKEVVKGIRDELYKAGADNTQPFHFWNDACAAAAKLERQSKEINQVVMGLSPGTIQHASNPTFSLIDLREISERLEAQCRKSWWARSSDEFAADYRLIERWQARMEHSQREVETALLRFRTEAASEALLMRLANAMKTSDAVDAKLARAIGSAVQGATGSAFPAGQQAAQ